MFFLYTVIGMLLTLWVLDGQKMNVAQFCMFIWGYPIWVPLFLWILLVDWVDRRKR